MFNKNSPKHRKRPVLDIPYSKLEVIIEAIAAVGILTMFVLIGVWWSKLPDQIPSHFGAAGLPDDWRSKGWIWLLPGIALAFYILLTVVSRFPQTFNLPWAITEENAERQYRIGRIMVQSLKAELIWILAYIQFGTIWVAMGKMNGLGFAFLFISLLVVFGTMALCLIQGYRSR